MGIFVKLFLSLLSPVPFAPHRHPVELYESASQDWTEFLQSLVDGRLRTLEERFWLWKWSCRWAVHGTRFKYEQQKPPFWKRIYFKVWKSAVGFNIGPLGFPTQPTGLPQGTFLRKIWLIEFVSHGTKSPFKMVGELGGVASEERREASSGFHPHVC